MTQQAENEVMNYLKNAKFNVSKDVLKYLIDKDKSSINSTDNTNNTPLMIYIRDRLLQYDGEVNPRIIDLLISEQNIETVCSYGMNALMIYLLYSETYNKNIIKKLVTEKTVKARTNSNLDEHRMDAKQLYLASVDENRDYHPYNKPDEEILEWLTDGEILDEQSLLVMESKNEDPYYNIKKTYIHLCSLLRVPPDDIILESVGL
jgi:hypothetical protein